VGKPILLDEEVSKNEAPFWRSQLKLQINNLPGLWLLYQLEDSNRLAVKVRGRVGLLADPS
jgi:hypothetical protein